MSLRFVIMVLVVAGCSSPSGMPLAHTSEARASKALTPEGRLRLSYEPTCKPGCPDARCLGGTEIQALETFEGRLYAGTTHWKETDACVWPGMSAQVMALDAPRGTWKALAPLPDAQNKCKPGIAPWEQVNDLEEITYRDGGESKRVLLASTMPNEDGGCPGLEGTVFYLDGEGKWIDTGLADKLSGHYGKRQSETRYVVSHVDGTAECPASKPCIFAFVGPRHSFRSGVGATVWRGRIDPHECGLICWDDAPEADFSGAELPHARRIVSAHSAGDNGVFLGTGASTPSPGDHLSLVWRNPRGKWTPIWESPPSQKGEFQTELRGIVGWTSPEDVFTLWFFTNPRGSVYRTELRNGRFTKPKLEVELVDVVNRECTKVYGYQLYFYARSDTDPNPVLAIASQSCPTRDGRTARIFYRHVASCTSWQSLELPELRDDVTTKRANEAALRWLERSPWDPKNLFLGTTDMNNAPGSLTARIYELSEPFPECR